MLTRRGRAAAPSVERAADGGAGLGDVVEEAVLPHRPLRFTRSAALATVVAVVAVRLGAAPLSDNSLFTHIATGRRLVDGGLGDLWGGMPDPYSRVSSGHPWVVQSWLASLLFGAVDALAGGSGLRVLFGVVTGLLALAVWRLARAGGLTVQVGVTVLVLAIGATAWLQRPLLFGLLGLAALLLLAAEERDARWAAPVMALWVNLHGSFPLGLVVIGARAIGRRLDGEDETHERRLLLWGALGTIVGGVANPVGPKVLLFPLQLLTRDEVLRYVVEWRSPDFAQGWTRLFLLLVLVAVAALVRRPSWRHALPAMVALAAALLATRNIAVAVVVLAPVVAHGLQGLGELDGRAEATGVWRAVPTVMVVALVAVLAGAVRTPAYDLRTYPVDGVAWLEQRSLLDGTHVVVHQDWVGNYLTLLDPPGFAVYLDDRFELHPPAFVTDYRGLVVGDPRWRATLEASDAEVLLWQKGTPLEALVHEAADWSVAWEDDGWFVACRPDVAACR